MIGTMDNTKEEILSLKSNKLIRILKDIIG